MVVRSTIGRRWPSARLPRISASARWRTQPRDRPGPFVAAGNYSRLLTSGDFAQSLTNTLWFAAFTVPAGLCLAVLFAQLLNARIWGRTGYRVTYFLPYITSTIAAAVVWRWIFQPRVGVANAVLQWVGLPGQQWADDPRGIFQLFGQAVGLPLNGWLAGPSLALVTVGIVSVWYSVGFNTVIALAGLTTIPPDLYEAARIDGASRWHLFRHITLPLLTPTLLFLRVIWGCQSWSTRGRQARAARLHGPQGQPAKAPVRAAARGPATWCV